VEGHGDALNEFESGYYSSAFPEIFLSGRAALNAERAIKLTEREWLEHLMWTGDGRVAADCFVAWSMLQRHQCLTQGSVYVSSHFANNPMPISELRDQIGRGDRSIPTSIFYWGANMRGSDAYMQGLKREIDALINHERSAPTCGHQRARRGCHSQVELSSSYPSEPSAVSSPHPPRAGRQAHDEEPPTPCLVALKATGLSLSASSTGEKGARWPDSIDKR